VGQRPTKPNPLKLTAVLKRTEMERGKGEKGR
jgi:hypothetical protein